MYIGTCVIWVICPEESHLNSENFFLKFVNECTQHANPQLVVKYVRTYVVMFEEAEHLQFTEDPLAGDEVLEDIGHLFEGHTLAVPGVSHRPERGREAQ